MVLAYEIRRIQGTLRFARSALTLATLIQLPLVAILLARYFNVQWSLTLRTFWMINGVSCVAGIIGFVIACRQLNLIDEALEDSPIPGFVREGRFPGSAKVLASAQLMFYGLFVIPPANALLFLWARWKAQSAIRDLDGALDQIRQGSAKARRPVTVM